MRAAHCGSSCSLPWPRDRPIPRNIRCLRPLFFSLREFSFSPLTSHRHDVPSDLCVLLRSHLRSRSPSCEAYRSQSANHEPNGIYDLDCWQSGHCDVVGATFPSLSRVPFLCSWLIGSMNVTGTPRTSRRQATSLVSSYSVT
jgi:hypothetical protein